MVLQRIRTSIAKTYIFVIFQVGGSGPPAPPPPPGSAQERINTMEHNIVLKQLKGYSNASGSLASTKFGVKLHFFTVHLITRRAFISLCALGIISVCNWDHYTCFFVSKIVYINFTPKSVRRRSVRLSVCPVSYYCISN